MSTTDATTKTCTEQVETNETTAQEERPKRLFNARRRAQELLGDLEHLKVDPLCWAKVQRIMEEELPKKSMRCELLLPVLNEAGDAAPILLAAALANYDGTGGNRETELSAEGLTEATYNYWHERLTDSLIPALRENLGHFPDVEEVGDYCWEAIEGLSNQEEQIVALTMVFDAFGNYAQVNMPSPDLAAYLSFLEKNQDLVEEMGRAGRRLRGYRLVAFAALLSEEAGLTDEEADYLIDVAIASTSFDQLTRTVVLASAVVAGMTEE